MAFKLQGLFNKNTNVTGLNATSQPDSSPAPARFQFARSTKPLLSMLKAARQLLPQKERSSNGEVSSASNNGALTTQSVPPVSTSPAGSGLWQETHTFHELSDTAILEDIEYNVIHNTI